MRMVQCCVFFQRLGHVYGRLLSVHASVAQVNLRLSEREVFLRVINKSTFLSFELVTVYWFSERDRKREVKQAKIKERKYRAIA